MFQAYKMNVSNVLLNNCILVLSRKFDNTISKYSTFFKLTNKCEYEYCKIYLQLKYDNWKSTNKCN